MSSSTKDFSGFAHSSAMYLYAIVFHFKLFICVFGSASEEATSQRTCIIRQRCNVTLSLKNKPFLSHFEHFLEHLALQRANSILGKNSKNVDFKNYDGKT